MSMKRHATKNGASEYKSRKAHRGLHKAARHKSILARLSDEQTCSIVELATALNVSGETIRRDIRELSAAGHVAKVHGAVVLPESETEQAYQKRLRINATEKRAIADAAVKLIPDASSLMIDTGSTTTYFARYLAERTRLIVITNCAEIARTVASKRGNEVYLAGGVLRVDDDATFGSSAVTFVEQFRADFAVLSVGGFSADGIMDYHLEEARLAQAMITRARTTMVLADSSKFRMAAPVWIADWSDVDVLVTDSGASADLIKALEAKDVEIRVVK